MAFFGIGSALSFVKRKVVSGGQFIVAGIGDRIATRCSGTKCDIGKHIAAKLSDCEPWTDHFEESTLVNVDKAVQVGDFADARGLLGLGVKETANGYCVSLLLDAVNLLASGAEATIEFLPLLE